MTLNATTMPNDEQAAQQEATSDWSDLIDGGNEDTEATEKTIENKVCERCGSTDFFDDGTCRSCTPDDDSDEEEGINDNETKDDSQYQTRLQNIQKYLTERTLERRKAEVALERIKIQLKEAIADENAAASQLENALADEPGDLPLIDKFAEPNENDDESNDDNYWLDMSLEEIDVPANICKLCAANPDQPIHTVGDIQTWSKAMGDFANPLQKIKGMGAKKAEQLEECLAKLWARRHIQQS